MKIGILGGSFNPVGLHHLKVLEHVLKLNFFNRIIILPCGPRPDKETVNDIDPIFRAAMLEITFRGYRDKIEISLEDLDKDIYTRTIDIEQRYKGEGDIWHILGFDLVRGGSSGTSAIQRDWAEGKRLWENSKFAIVKRKNFKFRKEDLPPNHILIETETEGSSTEIRNNRMNHTSIDHLVVPEVASYIKRYNLYRGRIPSQKTIYKAGSPRLLIIADETNPQAVHIRDKLQPYSNPENPNLIIDIGGDGQKLKTMRNFRNLRLPFFGINAGHRGFLQNDIPDIDLLFENDFSCHHLPLLQVDIRMLDGSTKSDLAFNEVWVERETGQSAWFKVTWDNKHEIPKVVGDGLMISTAAGSTGYAQNICKFSLPTHARELVFAGMGISEPPEWKDTTFSHHSSFKIESLDNTKRPIRAFVDGRPQGNIKNIHIKVSKTASVELAYLKDFDILEKHRMLQLPYFQNINN